jgi:hypothetical protein
MATLAEFRAAYPQYDSVPDVKLADSLHQKFYSQIPKMDFYKTIGLDASAMIPGNENAVTGVKPPEVSMRDRIAGIIETPMALAANVATGIPVYLAGVGGPEFQRKVAGQIQYQPRTQTAQDALSAVAAGFDALKLPPVIGGGMGTTMNALAGPAMQQTRQAVAPVVQQATAPARNVLANVMTREQPQMQGMGAASTADQMMREQRLQQLGIRSTTGERTQNLGQQQFESEAQRGVLTGVSEDTKTKLSEQMSGFKAAQKQDIVNNFERMTAEVGAEVADPTQMRQVGKIVDKALNDEYTRKYNKYKELYDKADNSGETLQPVSYQNLLDFINSKTPTQRQKIDPILDSVAESLAMNDPGKTGTITVRALEDIYQEIGKVQNSANAKDLKQIITQMGEGAGGEMYQAARLARKQLAKEFEDVHRVDKLLSTKAGYTDRRVALDDVFKHVVLDGSLEEMRTVTTLLKKSGPEGRKAYAELQGQTIQHMKEMLTKSDQMSFKNLNTLITQLDSEDKLTYMFGKTGRDQILDLRDAIKDVVVKQPGAVNYSNTSGAVLRGLETLQRLPINVPGVKTAAEFARERQYKKQLEKALQQPNQLAPTSPNKNALVK